MEAATSSDIEFVGIAADRKVVISANRRERDGSCDGSASISLVSVSSDIERHDQSLTASAFDIQEVYTVVPVSPSTFVVDFVPDPLTKFEDASDDDLNLPATPPWSSRTLPLDRYCQDSQRHELVAVSTCQAVDLACDLADLDAPLFRRSPAPSPSTRRGLEACDHHVAVPSNAVAAQPVADADEHDYHYYFRRWYASTLEKAQELTVELQQTTAQPPAVEVQQTTCQPPPPPEPPFHPAQTQALVSKQHGKAHGVSSTISSIDLVPIEPDSDAEVNQNRDTDETLQEFMSSNALKSRERDVHRAHRLKRFRKRKIEEENHLQGRPSRPPTTTNAVVRSLDIDVLLNPMK